MDSYNVRRIIQIAFIVIVIGVAIAILVYAFRALFPTIGQAPQPNPYEKSLLNTNADRAVNMRVRGPIVADENFRAYQIQVTPSARAFTQYKGYEYTQIANENLNNNIPAYEQFVYALNRANMMNGLNLSGSADDTRGVCAAGTLYQFDILQGDKTVKTYWTTTCNSDRGSLRANLNQLTNLFIKQIPNAQTNINKLWQSAL